MTDDVDMDAPQISTLREETTPEPNPARSKFRVKLLVADKGDSSKASSVSSKRGRGDSDEEEEGEFATVGKGGKAMTFTPDSIFKNLQLVQEARGKKVRPSRLIEVSY